MSYLLPLQSLWPFCVIFRQLCERLTPFYQSSSKCYQTELLQSLLNCLEKNPEMELAVVATTTGLTECLENEKIAASAKAVDATDAAKTDTSLLQAAKVSIEIWPNFHGEKLENMWNEPSLYACMLRSPNAIFTLRLLGQKTFSTIFIQRSDTRLTLIRKNWKQGGLKLPI